MSISAARTARALIKGIRFEKDRMCVRLQYGRELRVPLKWFPRLSKGTAAQRRDWRLIGGGVGIHWESLDEDVSLQGLLGT